MNTPTQTPHQYDRPMPGARWLAIAGRMPANDELVTVGCSCYAAGDRISVSRGTSIPDIPPVGGNIFTGSAIIRVSVENMPPVLADRILNLMDGAVAILCAGADSSVLSDGWQHIDKAPAGR